jgi:hypothetical protein
MLLPDEKRQPLMLKKCEGHNEGKTEGHRIDTDIEERFTAVGAQEERMVVLVYARLFAYQGQSYPEVMDLKKTQDNCFNFVAPRSKIHPKCCDVFPSKFHVSLAFPCIFLSIVTRYEPQYPSLYSDWLRAG